MLLDALACNVYGAGLKNYFLIVNRSFSDAGIKGIINWLEGDHSGHWLGFLTRQVMENATSFEEAFKALSNTKMLAPAYFILGGNSSSQVS